MNRTPHFRLWQSVLWFLLLILPVGGNLYAQQPPVDANFDWAKQGGKRARTLIYYVETTPFRGDNGVVVPGAAKFPVMPPPGAKNGTPPPNCLPGYIEESPNNCGVYTIGRAMDRAAATWNSQMTGWTLKKSNLAIGNLIIIVRMSRPAYTDANGIFHGEEMDQPTVDPNDPYGDAPIDDPNTSFGGKAAGVLAYFQCLTVSQKDCAFAQLVFNRMMLANAWSISHDNKNVGPADPTWDPIIVALHEIGHALRLDHSTIPGDQRINIGAPNGIVMRPFVGQGMHNTNPTNAGALAIPFARNPFTGMFMGVVYGDIPSAMSSAANPAP